MSVNDEKKIKMTFETPDELAQSSKDLSPRANSTEQQNAQSLSSSAVEFEIPRDYAELPSMGLVYPPFSPLHGKKEILYRHMISSEEDILYSISLVRSGKAIDMVLNNCVLEKNLDLNELLIGDRNALMLALRLTSLGSNYAVDVTCPSCQETLEYVFDLGLVKLKYLELQPTVPNTNSFEFKTPSNRTLEFKFLTSGDSKELTIIRNKLKKSIKSDNDQNITMKLKKQILSVDGNDDPQLISRYVDHMLTKDIRALDAFINENEPGVIMEQFWNCSACGHEKEMEVPMSTNFFWPNK